MNEDSKLSGSSSDAKLSLLQTLRCGALWVRKYPSVCCAAVTTRVIDNNIITITIDSMNNKTRTIKMIHKKILVNI